MSPPRNSWSLATAGGAVGIAVISFACGVFLFYELWRQGRGKLRVRILLGMITSDILIALVAFPAEIMYVAGKPMGQPASACSVYAFIYSAVVFAQNLWALGIGMVTFCLLKHPLHPFTTMLEKYAWVMWPAVWGLSFLHSGIWWATVGWDNSGTLCWYGTRDSDALDRNLVQFIPRAVVFVVLLGLYSRLFTFLRRPDTIHLSSHGTPTPSSIAHGTVSAVSAPALAVKRLSRGCCVGDMGLEETSGPAAANPKAPWEALEFCSVGGKEKSTLDSNAGLDSFIASIPSRVTSRAVSPVTSLASPPVSPISTRFEPEPGSPLADTPTTLVGDRPGASGAYDMVARGSITATLWSEKFPEPRGSVTSVSFDTPPAPRKYTAQSGTTLVPPSVGAVESAPAFEPVSFRDPFKAPPKTPDEEDEGGLEKETEKRRVNPLPSFTAAKDVLAGDSDSDEDNTGPTLRDFLMSNQVETGGTAATSNHMSATAYFNKQASMLMLWCPVAYMANFGVSLIRLVYGMASEGGKAPFLALISSWCIIGAGIFDCLVFGVAEYVVRRRVRKKMPHHIGQA